MSPGLVFLLVVVGVVVLAGAAFAFLLFAPTSITASDRAVERAQHPSALGNTLDRWAAEEQAAKDRQAQVVCPHCQTRGSVTARQVRRKKGVSGGKATGALLTGGVSMLATGLSRKESSREMSCSNCGTTWDVG